jgi:beta-glucosidase
MRYNTLSIFLFFSTVLSIQLLAQPKNPVYQNSKVSLEKRVNDLCQRMTLEEKADMLSGVDDWHFKGVPRLGVPSVQVSDCGHGVTIILNKTGDWIGNSTCFPTATSQAATWNKGLIQEVGSALGRETRATGSAILLAPMVNIKRHPLNGRNYECFSEDPYLTAIMASSFINGVQSEHVGAVIKAMAANNQQTNQHDINVNADERTLQEIYLNAFRIAIKKSNPWGLMTAYNGLNGDKPSESSHLFTEILRKDWNYKGFVVSDWRAVSSLKALYAGVDIEMPGPGKFMTKKNILKAIDEKAFTVNQLDEKVKHILRALVQTKLIDVDKPALNSELNSPKHQTLARKVAEEGIVLLKNKNNILPLNLQNIKKIAVIGPNASEARLGGGGSASVSPFYSISPLQGIRKMCADKKIEIVFEEGCGLNGNLKVIDQKYLSFVDNGNVTQGIKGNYFSNRDLKGQPAFSCTDNLINFSWGWANPKPGISKHNYSVQWTGQILPPATGDYKIGISAAECGYRLYINGKLEIDEWATGSKDNFEANFLSSNKNVTIHLEEGKPADVKVEFWKRMNRNFIRLEWEMPGNNSLDLAVNAAKDADAVVVFAGLSNFFEGGNNDRKDIIMPGDQDKLIAEIAKVNPNVVVVLINGSPVAMPWINNVKGIVEAFYPGQEGGNAIANVLFGKVNPSGKLPETFPTKISDTPAYGNFPGVNNQVNYAEGIYVGYRHYDAKNIEPLFPFGFGLSYSQFEYSNLKIKKQGKKIRVTFQLKNSGKMDGAEVAQLYIHDIKCSEDRPSKELKTFEKVFLKAGETKMISMTLDNSTFEMFSKTQNKWIIEKGEFEVLIGSSSRDIRLKGSSLLK